VSYRNHAAASEETACHIVPQSPSDRSKAAISPAPGASFVATATAGRDRPGSTCREPLRSRNFGA